MDDLADSAPRDLTRLGDVWPKTLLLLWGLSAAIALRIEVSGASGSRSIAGGLVFAAVLLALVLGGQWRPLRPTARGIGVGLLGAAALLAVPIWLRVSGTVPPSNLPATTFLGWGLVVGVVAAAEELLLRGVLFSALERAAGPETALVTTAIAFALLHVPLYGIHVLPLDLAVGLWLGALRIVSGGVAAPLVAHTVADLAAWWL